MFLKDLIKKGAATISTIYPEREAREMVFVYLERAIGTQKHTHIVEPEYEVSDADVLKAESAFQRMASGEPLQYIMGQAYFYARTFNVNPDVLIPRPETEILCREAILRAGANGHSGLRILDLCTGSGCIAWTMALECPGSDVTAVDISDGALRTAAGQDFKEELGVTGAKIPHFLKSDVLKVKQCCCDVLANDEADSGFDIILSNPPYVKDSEKALMRQNVLEHEPHLALFVPDDDPLMFYTAVADCAVRLLSPDGFGIVEINEALGPETAQIYLNAGFSKVSIIKDLSEKDRFVMFSR